MSITYDFSGRSALITGAGRGIGLAIAKMFLESGADVWLADIDSSTLTDSCAGTQNANAVTCDVRDATAVHTTIETIVASTGRLDVLVNNAGILRDGVLWKLSDAEWNAVLDVHLTGTFNCTRAAVPVMRTQGSGRVINVTSYTGLHGNFGQTNYAAAKAGIIGFTRAAAKELAAFGITVNAISPNADTEMVESIPPEQRSRLMTQIPMSRFGRAEEMASAVGFLAADESSYITGVVLPVDGGLSI